MSDFLLWVSLGETPFLEIKFSRRQFIKIPVFIDRSDSKGYVTEVVKIL